MDKGKESKPTSEDLRLDKRFEEIERLLKIVIDNQYAVERNHPLSKEN